MALHSIIFMILTFISEKYSYFKHMYKILRYFILFDIKKGKNGDLWMFILFTHNYNNLHLKLESG